ncbi:MAG: hypothetical protein K9G38_02715, partial [Bacteroidales bacterium]|nr:hypothetical protein [Bacteroidales bacterium]
ILAKLVNDLLGRNDFTSAVNSEYIYDRFPHTPQIAKKKFLIGIFSKGSNVHNKELSQLFPSLARYIKIIKKTTLFRNGQKLKKYKNTSCVLQREESKIFRLIWKKLLNENIRFINIHDAVYVDRSNLEITHEIMTGVFDTMLKGVNARIKVESVGKPIE